MTQALRWFLGADSDMHVQSSVVIDENKMLVRIHLTKVHASIIGRDALIAMADELGRDAEQQFFGCAASAVESQEIAYSARSGANPRSLLMLANVSGMLISHLCPRCPKVYLPAPAKWKGSMSKKIHQARTCRQMGWEYTAKSTYLIPTVDLSDIYVVGKLNPSDWKHILDSVGLALWARDTYLKTERRERVLSELRSE